MATAKQSPCFDAETDSAMRQFFKDALQDPDVVGVLKTHLKEALKELLKEEPLKTHLNVKALSLKANEGSKANVSLKEPLKEAEQSTEGSKAKGLKPEVLEILTNSGMNPDWIRFFDSRHFYFNILNNPYSGNLEDAVRLAHGFAKKETFAGMLNDFVKKHPAPVPSAAPEAPEPPPVPPSPSTEEPDMCPCSINGCPDGCDCACHADDDAVEVPAGNPAFVIEED